MRLEMISTMQANSQIQPQRPQDNVIDVKAIKTILYLAIDARALLETAPEEKHAVDTFV